MTQKDNKKNEIQFIWNDLKVEILILIFDFKSEINVFVKKINWMERFIEKSLIMTRYYKLYLHKNIYEFTETLVLSLH